MAIKVRGGWQSLLTYENLCRFFCLYFSAILVTTFVQPTYFFADAQQIDAKWLGEGNANVVVAWIQAVCWSYACIYFCASDLSPYAQRKLLFFTRIGSLGMIASVFTNGMDLLPQAAQHKMIATQLVMTGFTLYVLLSVYAGNETRSGSRTQNRQTSCLRVMYLQQFAWALGWLFNADNTMGMLGGTVDAGASQFYVRILGVSVFTIATCTAVVAERFSDADQKKYIQYMVIGMLGWVYAFGAAAGDMIYNKVGIEMAQAQLFMLMGNLIALVWAIYPAEAKVWYLRFRVVQWFLISFLIFLNPQLPTKLAAMTTQYSDEASTLIGALLFNLALVALWASTASEGAQDRQMQYSCFGWVFFLYMSAWEGKFDLGIFLIPDAVLLLYKAFLVYPQYFAFLDSKLNAMKRSKSPSPMRRGRSQTPKMKKA